MEVVCVGIGEEIRGRSESALLRGICQSTAECTYGRANVLRELSGMTALLAAAGHCDCYDARLVPEARPAYWCLSNDLLHGFAL